MLPVYIFRNKTYLLAMMLGCFLINTSLGQTGDLAKKLIQSSSYTIDADDELHSYMNSLAEEALAEHCVSCHGNDLQGQLGVPDLTDYDWLWGITGFEANSVEPVFKIMQTILYGVRNIDCPDDIKRYGACPDTRFSQMPGYGTLGYTEQQVDDLAEYVIDISGGMANQAAVNRAEPFWIVCTECHGEDGYGYKPYGGPDLRDDVWLFGGSKEQIVDVIDNGRTEACPAWANTLEPVTIKALAVYLYNKSQDF